MADGQDRNSFNLESVPPVAVVEKWLMEWGQEITRRDKVLMTLEPLLTAFQQAWHNHMHCGGTPSNHLFLGWIVVAGPEALFKAMVAASELSSVWRWDFEGATAYITGYLDGLAKHTCHTGGASDGLD